MPLCPQVTITPVVLPREVAISGVTFTPTTATYTASGHSFTAGNTVIITGLLPNGYNGTYVVNSVSGSTTFTVLNTTNTTVTDQSGLATPGGVYSNSSVIAAGDPATTEQLSTVNSNAAAAQAAAIAAQAEAAAALSAAGTAYTTAINSLQPSAYAIQNPTTKQLSSIDATGLTVYVNSPTAGPRVVMNSLGLAGYNSSGPTFSISASTGDATFAGDIVTGARIIGGTMNIGGNAIINSGGFLTATGATITGHITADSGSFTGAIYASSGYIGNASTGWNFSASGYITNSDNTTIFYPTASSNTYVLITDRAISANGFQSSGNILTTGTARVTAQGTNTNRCEFSFFNTISLHSISSGYGVDSDWSPNSDNSYDLGQATSAGAGANRRWRRLYSNNTTISTSDVNAKTDVVDSALGLDFINSLRPVGYRWIVGQQEVVKDAEGNPTVVGESPEGKPIFEMAEIPGKRLHYGFIAQEVKQAVDVSGVEDFAGWVQDDLGNPNSTQSLSYEQFIAPMAKAIQELSARVQQLEGA